MQHIFRPILGRRLKNIATICDNRSVGRWGGAVVRQITRELNDFVQLGEEVEDAKKRNAPIVALESTIITHGMPYPDNLATAKHVEDIIREKGVVPATIGIINGKIQIGMDSDHLEKLANCAGGTKEKATKCSRRDIATIIGENSYGGTTVGGTMTIARMADIPIMATGGIGGVHRGAEMSLDISSDLTELGRNRVGVVCAGVKAILDIPKTLEYLETQGVPVVTISDTESFPAFYCRETSLNNPVKSPSRIRDAEEAARLLRIQEVLGLDSGILFAVPIPKSHALDSAIVESMILETLEAAQKNGIQGKNVTPFLLKRLNELTTGGFLRANQALVENNARVAAEMALALNGLRRRNNKGSSGSTLGVQQPSSSSAASVQAPAVVIGGATVDTMLHVEDPAIALDGRTHRAKSRESYGGVGRNIAAAMNVMGLEKNTKFISVVGDDSAGRSIVRALGDAGKTVEISSEVVTCRYTAILDDRGECRLGMGEMDTFDAIDAKILAKHRETVEKAGLIVLDGNLPLETMRACVEIAATNKIPVWYEPTDVSKATKIFEAASPWINDPENPVIKFISPNINELLKIAKYMDIPLTDDTDSVPHNNSNQISELSIEKLSAITKKLAETVPIVLTTLGPRGVLVTRKGSTLEPFFVPTKKSGESSQDNREYGKIEARWYAVPRTDQKKLHEKFSVSGCGDCLTAAIITGSYRGLNELDCVKFALRAAAISLRSHETVPPTLGQLRTFSFSE